MSIPLATTSRPIPTSSPGEEAASAVTHGIGVALAITALVLLVVNASLHGDAWRITTLAIFGGTLVLTYLASTVYHIARGPRARHALRVVDHISIYLLIAGTYTPIALVTLGGGWGWTMFSLIWALAAIGIAFKLATARTIGQRFERLSIAIFLLMGWLVVIAAAEVIQSMTTPGLLWLLAGGIAYTTGVIFYRWHRLRYHHAIWHGFVMLGSACHVAAMWFDVLPMG